MKDQSNLTKEKKEIHPFKPIIFKKSRYLILGSFPSIDSFENSFTMDTKIINFGRFKCKLLIPHNNIDQKIWLLKKFDIGLWDMIKAVIEKIT